MNTTAQVRTSAVRRPIYYPPRGVRLRAGSG